LFAVAGSLHFVDYFFAQFVVFHPLLRLSLLVLVVHFFAFELIGFEGGAILEFFD
jgi:hypothetical protein